ncbi:non-structural maintenance of chromosomes element 4 homolog A-like [Arachis hypogaea]|uniref:non-structural maintenance of chromosomes element 4 homolog A-like n=1 Tax=Arachis hypogaea TaxID=3818 RepID=UPI0011057105|nr:non-structural maintenance of chromosomes element 4 homolog A-like [Arachis hypogaea]
MAKHQLNYSDCHSTAINTKLRRQLPPAHDDTDYRTHQSLRSRYLAFNNMINDERDEIARADSKKFELIFGKMEITKPREQVADAKALLDIMKSLVMSMKGHANGGVTPSEFVSHILEEFGGQGRSSTSTERCTKNSTAWNDIGLSLDGGPREVKANTDKNMLTMFNILRKNSVVKLENLILNRNSFAQIVENLLALSFIVKDGRAEIKVNEAGSQLVLSPRNSPRANAIRAGDIAFGHFMFRLDFKDWKVYEAMCYRRLPFFVSYSLMIDSFGVVEDLMPYRE